MTMDAKKKRSNRRTVIALTVVVFSMFGFGYALVPLYDLFCEITGIGGNPTTVASLQMDADAVSVDPNRELTVEFIGTSNNGLPLSIEPIVTKTKVSPGQVHEVHYTIQNASNRDYYVQAIPSVSPIQAARYFVKLECFCFENQKLVAGESAELPVRFYVDTKAPNDIKTVTLSYSFFEVDKPENFG